MLDRLPEELEHIEREGAAKLADRRFVRYIAWVEGKPAGAATATFAPGGAILTGSVLPWARGRGAYRALVGYRRARRSPRGADGRYAGERDVASGLLGLGFKNCSRCGSSLPTNTAGRRLGGTCA